MAEEPLDLPTAKQVAAGFKALSDPARVQIVSRIASSSNGELCGCEFPDALNLSQPTVSHQLKLLTDAGILNRDQRGKWAYFSIAPGALNTLGSLLTERS